MEYICQFNQALSVEIAVTYTLLNRDELPRDTKAYKFQGVWHAATTDN
jgi:hypothetical protein